MNLGFVKMFKKPNDDQMKECTKEDFFNHFMYWAKEDFDYDAINGIKTSQVTDMNCEHHCRIKNEDGYTIDIQGDLHVYNGSGMLIADFYPNFCPYCGRKLKELDDNQP